MLLLLGECVGKGKAGLRRVGIEFGALVGGLVACSSICYHLFSLRASIGPEIV